MRENQRRQKPTPVERLVKAMDDCARARSDAAWIQGYRARVEAFSHDPKEARRLYDSEQAKWKFVDRVEVRFRRIAARLLREERKGAKR